MTNFENFDGHKLPRKGLKTAKPRKFMSAKVSFFKVYAQNEAANTQSNCLRVNFKRYLLLHQKPDTYMNRL